MKTFVFRNKKRKIAKPLADVNKKKKKGKRKTCSSLQWTDTRMESDLVFLSWLEL